MLGCEGDVFEYFVFVEVFVDVCGLKLDVVYGVFVYVLRSLLVCRVFWLVILVMCMLVLVKCRKLCVNSRLFMGFFSLVIWVVMGLMIWVSILLVFMLVFMFFRKVSMLVIGDLMGMLLVSGWVLF